MKACFFSPFPCGPVTTACLRARLADGPGKCAGRLEMKFSGKWFRVGKKWSDANSHLVCKELGCGNARLNQPLDPISPGSLPFLKQLLNCDQSLRLSDCQGEDITLRPEDQHPTMLVCEGLPVPPLHCAPLLLVELCSILLLINSACTFNSDLC